ncbi:MAG: HD domain-containing protein, partial [Paraclostridium sp.]
MENKIVDYIYGEFELEDVLIELINCDAVQRLKYIHQVGATYLIKEELNVNRLEHSIGVMLLIRMLGGSLKEQIAGLLHDISHTAFSHVIDFV